MGKRKGDDVLATGVPAVVSAEATTHNDTSRFSAVTGFTSSAPEWIDSASLDHKLRVVRENLKLGLDDEDDFLREVSHCEAQLESFQRQQTKLLDDSTALKEKLHAKITQQQSRCQQELSNVEAMEDELREIVQERDSIQRDIAELNRMSHDLEAKISLAMEEAAEVVEEIDMLEEARKNQVPRIKHQLSLYARSTGISWHYGDGSSLLKGEVVSRLCCGDGLLAYVPHIAFASTSPPPTKRFEALRLTRTNTASLKWHNTCGDRLMARTSR